MKSFLIYFVLASSLLLAQPASDSFIIVKTPAQQGEPVTATAVKSTDWGSFAMLGEAGYKTLRGSATYGARFSKSTRFKVSGEYLTQKLDFDFKGRGHNNWSKQYALGTEFQAILTHTAIQSIDLSAAYVHAFRQTNIASSDGALTSAGLTLSLWKCAYLSVAADYDFVKFHRRHKDSNIANGIGGSATFVQGFAKDYTLSLETEVRQPFIYYGGMLNWNHQFKSCALNIGLFADNTNGREGVRHLTTGGLQLGISFGGARKECPRTTMENDACYSRSYCDLGEWVSKPAIRVPIVVTRADPVCDQIPEFHIISGIDFGELPTGTPSAPATVNFNNTSTVTITSWTVSSSNTTIATVSPSGSSTPIAPGGSASFTVTGHGYSTPPLSQTAVITVTAFSSCGASVSHQFGVTVLGD